MDKICRELLLTACKAVDPKRLVYESLKVSGTSLTVKDRHYQLKQNVYILAFGKAAFGMVQGAEAALGDHIVKGIASVPVGSLKVLDADQQRLHLRTKFFEGAANNLPDSAALKTASMIESCASTLKSDDIVLVLVSGGGSALLPAPAGNISLEEKVTLTKKLAACGAGIEELNSVRQNLSRLKGGKLARLLRPASIVALIISDIVGNPLDLIASGPTVPKTATKSTALAVLQKYKLVNNASQSIRDWLHATDVDDAEDEDKGDERDFVQNLIVGNNMTALRAAEHAGLQHVFEVAIVRCDVTGHAADIGRRFAQVARAFADGRCALEALRQAQLLKGDAIHSPTSWNSDRLCLLFGGETTVELTGNGVGGRNQEMVLAFLIEAARLGLGESTVDFALLSAGTDGQDGPTDSAGAFADRHAVGTVDQQDAQRCLQNNDSYSFWKAFDNGRCHLLIGHTGTNVMDVQGLLLSRRSADIE